MEYIKRIAYLRFLSLFVVLLLGSIQCFLVGNSYNLTKENYIKEISIQTDNFRSLSAVTQTRSLILSGVLNLAEKLVNGKITKREFLEQLTLTSANSRRQADSSWLAFTRKHPIMRKISYTEQYDWILLKKGGYTDSLLKTKASPIRVLGPSSVISKGWLISKTQSTTEVLVNKSRLEKNFAKDNYSLILCTSNNTYGISQREVLMRMLLIFILSFTLIIALIIILFLNFKTIYQQKKIADIKTDFATNITHELQTPVSTIALIIKTLKNETVQTSQQLLHETIDALDRQQVRLKTSIDSVLESAMLERHSIELEPLEMFAFLRTYLEDYRKDSHLFEIELLSHPVILRTEKQTLERILTNILDNAAKYSESHTVIHISTKLSGRFYAISIRDEGTGIEKEQHRFIFDKFYRVPQYNLHAVKGIGLGLYLCDELIKKLNGFISLESDKGKGSTFTIHIPLS